MAQLPQPDYAENLWPAVEGFQTQVEAYFAEAARVARVMTRIFADALVLGVAACVLAGEAAVRDFERVDEERGGEKTE